MNHYFNFVVNAVSGKPLPGAAVSVLRTNGSLATLASDNNGTPLANPVFTDDQGNFSFYVDDGTYTLQIVYGANTLATIRDVEIGGGLDADGVRAAAVENAIGVSVDRAPSQAAVGAAFGGIADTSNGASRVGYGGRTVKAFMDDLVNVKRFGAVGDGVADDRPAIQAAINAAAVSKGAVYIPDGIYRLTLVPAPSGGGVCALTLASGVELIGASEYGSILRIAAGAIGPGTYLRGICTNGRVQNCAIRNLAFDGNRQNQGLYADQGNGGNIVISATEVTISNVQSFGANGQGIQVVGTEDNPVQNVKITNCRVDNTAGATLNPDGSVVIDRNGNGCGIQVSHAKTFTITGNIVTDTKDNCIDVYAERSTGDPSGGECLISNNNLGRGRVGIFPETSARVLVTNNVLRDMAEGGVSINRINSAPSRILVSTNLIIGGGFGVRVTGDSASPGISIENNTIVDFAAAGITLERTAYVGVTGNSFSAANANVPLVLFASTYARFIRVSGNRYWGQPATGRLALNQTTGGQAADFFMVNVDDWMSLDGNTDARTDNAFRRAHAELGTLALTASTVTTTAPAAGAGGALPATPAGYVTVPINGTARLLPYY